MAALSDDSETYETLKKYTRDALSLLNERTRASPVRSILKQKWQADGSHFVRSTKSAPVFDFTIRELESELRSLPSYIDAFQALHGNASFSPHLDTMVGSVSGSIRIDSDRILNSCLLKILEASHNQTFDELAFDQHYQALKDEIYAPTIPMKRLTPLLGVLIEKPIKIADGLDLVILSDNEISYLLEYGYRLGRLLPSQYGDICLETHRAGIRESVLIKKYFGSMSDDERRQASQGSWNLFSNGSRQAKLVDALRLFKPGSFLIGGSLTYSESMFGVGVSYSHAALPYFPNQNQYSLILDDGEHLTSLFESLNSKFVTDRKFLDIAIRRFVYAEERTRYDDRLIDYLVAAEALFLSDHDSRPTEVTHRLAERAAYFLGNNVEERIKLFRFFKNAYSIRSYLVHGGEPNLPKNEDGLQITIQEFVDELNVYLRSSLLRIIELAQLPMAKKGIVDWTSLVLSGSNSDTGG